MADGVVVANVDLGDLVFPVVAEGPDGQLLKPHIYGTAFCIGPGIFVTAGHVITNVLADGGEVVVARITETDLVGKKAAKTEVLRSGDVGVMLARTGGPTLLDWDTRARPLLHTVSAVGFPFAVNRVATPPSFKVTMRAFKGHVQTRTQLWTIPGEPVGYEISTTFPKGMSGAPLMNAEGAIPMLKIVGIVLGNVEVEAFGEVTRFGIALDIQTFSGLSSPEIIGGTFAELRDRVLSKEEFQFDPSRPFLQWSRRERQ